MRTTVRIDDDLLRLLKQQAQRDDLALTEVVNSAIRRGLAADAEQISQASRTYREKTFAMGQPAALLDKALALAATLEDEEVLEKLARRK